MSKVSFRFEKLEVWRKAIGFGDGVYRATSTFPDSERFGLISQMRRAAVSISSNIAEGSGRSTDKEFSRFLEIAYGSLMEVVSQSHIAVRQGFLEQEQFDKLYTSANEVSRMLSGLRKSLNQ